MRRSYLKWLFGLGGVLVVALPSIVFIYRDNSDALWQIVSRQCVPNQQQSQRPAPCQQVNLPQGYVLLKDRVGELQYLLIPTAKITGIESPALLSPQTPDFFSFAWQHRTLLSRKFGADIPNSYLSLAINSEYGRTQNQLHIHLSCLRNDVRQTLLDQQSQLRTAWQPLTLANHPYWVRTLTEKELANPTLFKRISVELPGGAQEMGHRGVALTALGDGRLVVMVIERDGLRGILASAEELQDHDCAAISKDHR